MSRSVVAERSRTKTVAGFTPERLIEIYRLIYLSRRTDDREIILKHQQKIFFQISGAGHEALLVAAGLVLKSGYDWFFPYYRDRGLVLALGVSVEDLLLQSVGAASDPASGGRQMPSHWSSPAHHIVSQSSATTTQCLHAVGCAEAGRYFTHHPEAAEKHEGDYRAWRDVEFHGDEVVYVSLGEGSTSQGEFWEALNTASNEKLPVIFVVEDNGYAISVPVEVNTPGGSISSSSTISPISTLPRSTEPTSSSASASLRRRPRTAARAKDLPLFMAMLHALTPIRIPMTTASTGPNLSAALTRYAIRFPRRRCFCSAKACWTPKVSPVSKKRSMKRFAMQQNLLSTPRCPRP